MHTLPLPLPHWMSISKEMGTKERHRSWIPWTQSPPSLSVPFHVSEEEKSQHLNSCADAWCFSKCPRVCDLHLTQQDRTSTPGETTDLGLSDLPTVTRGGLMTGSSEGLPSPRMHSVAEAMSKSALSAMTKEVLILQVPESTCCTVS